MTTPDRPSPPDGGDPRRDDAFGDAPDRWAEADAAWEAKWSEDDSASDADAPEALPPPGEAYRPVQPTTASVGDAYGDGMREAGPYLGLGLQIGGSMALFVGAGVLADRFFGTEPWGVLIGAALGMIGILALVVRVANEANKKR